eukprot:19115-Heterococcus_DN1.PRE.2
MSSPASGATSNQYLARRTTTTLEHCATNSRSAVLLKLFAAVTTSMCEAAAAEVVAVSTTAGAHCRSDNSWLSAAQRQYSKHHEQALQTGWLYLLELKALRVYSSSHPANGAAGVAAIALLQMSVFALIKAWTTMACSAHGAPPPAAFALSLLNELSMLLTCAQEQAQFAKQCSQQSWRNTSSQSMEFELPAVCGCTNSAASLIKLQFTCSLRSALAFDARSMAPRFNK